MNRQYPPNHFSSTAGPSTQRYTYTNGYPSEPQPTGFETRQSPAHPNHRSSAQPTQFFPQSVPQQSQFYQAEHYPHPGPEAPPYWNYRQGAHIREPMHFTGHSYDQGVRHTPAYPTTQMPGSTAFRPGPFSQSGPYGTRPAQGDSPSASPQSYPYASDQDTHSSPSGPTSQPCPPRPTHSGPEKPQSRARKRPLSPQPPPPVRTSGQGQGHLEHLEAAVHQEVQHQDHHNHSNNNNNQSLHRPKV